ncbi:MAG TPA: carboxypeptidase-like regulatory domain-containing protein [Ignavibacteriales bacterium]|nr:carboxypeptidase-like regulatory domain-containing protein [Ignavibacteriales bacterium]
MDVPQVYNRREEALKRLLPVHIIKNILTIAFIMAVLLRTNLQAGSEKENNAPSKNETINFTVTVLDKNTQAPLQYVVVVLREGGSIVASASTNPFGKVVFNDLGSGSYLLSTHYVGYNDFNDTVLVDPGHKGYGVFLSESTVQLNEVVVQGSKIQNSAASIDIISGRQVFEGETYHASPAGTMTQLIQQNLSGAVRAPTGEVHIRGSHGEFSYLVDGIPIPLGVFGGLNEIVDPKVISKITFYTGGFPAEFGGQLAGLMDIQNKVPTGRFHLDLSSFAGSYLTSNSALSGGRIGAFKALNSNGQSISLSDHPGNLGYFIGASRQETDRRIDQPAEELFHDHGSDYFAYGKFDYLINGRDYVTMNLNYSKTQTQVPYDPAEGIRLDNQDSYNSFQTLSYFHTISTEPENETNLFIGGFAREGGLNFIPDLNDGNKTYLNSDSSTGYVVGQNRKFTTLGIRAKYDERLSHHFKYAVGFNYGDTFGREDFSFFNASSQSIGSNTRYHGYDAGIFAETEWHPFEWIRLDLGLRYDVHNAPSAANEYELSPRIKWNVFINEFNSLTLSYDRLFMPSNIENLGSVASLLGNNAPPAVPEKDNLYELTFLRNWQNGFSSKISGFYKEAAPGLDDETLGSSTIRVNVNIARVKVSGFDMSLTYNHPEVPLSGSINGSLIHAYGRGPVTGGFLPADPSTDVFDLDHDERLSGSIVLNYQPENWFVNFSANYASGLTNGNENYAFRTGLFSFNQGAHTTPAWIFNLSGGFTIKFSRGQTIEPSVYVTNLLDHEHLIKGAFFSGASFEERRNVVFKLTYHL